MRNWKQQKKQVEVFRETKTQGHSLSSQEEILMDLLKHFDRLLGDLVRKDGLKALVLLLGDILVFFMPKYEERGFDLDTMEALEEMALARDARNAVWELRHPDWFDRDEESAKFGNKTRFNSLEGLCAMMFNVIDDYLEMTIVDNDVEATIVAVSMMLAALGGQHEERAADFLLREKRRQLSSQVGQKTSLRFTLGEMTGHAAASLETNQGQETLAQLEKLEEVAERSGIRLLRGRREEEDVYRLPSLVEATRIVLRDIAVAEDELTRACAPIFGQELVKVGLIEDLDLRIILLHAEEDREETAIGA
ncbi:MAG: hypothetical protein COV67_10530 [Nitrospinae bacterium CG11_big_fil_rev_8_21_14_0_20_56_8]|nr:MAG: hypothetical protein COV67_10530 [Nitrospinae bacterium CG11_big_fil_rev_8_21_14_0_20_56_8]